MVWRRCAEVARAVGTLAIYGSELDSEALSSALPTTDKTADSNDDMMILVVDDHPSIAACFGRQLGSLGYRCKTANDGVDALNVLVKNAIDIVLSDVNMPGMDGYHDAAYPSAG